MFSQASELSHKRCPSCKRNYHCTPDNMFTHCPFDGTFLINIVDVPIPDAPIPGPSATQEEIPLVISWCEKCQVPFNHSKLAEDPATHEKACPICKGPVKIVWTKQTGLKTNVFKDDLAMMLVAGFVEALGPTIKQVAISELTKIVRKAI